MRKINDTINRLTVTAYVKGGRMRKKLAGLYALFKDTILPTLTQRIQNLFNYQG